MKAFLATRPLRNMSGQEKMLAVLIYRVGGKIDEPCAVSEINTNWPSALLETHYHSTFVERAETAGWLNRHGKELRLTDHGLKHFLSIGSEKTASVKGEIRQVGQLYIVNRKGTHSFDKMMRAEFASAKTRISIVDSYVDETIFDTILDAAGKNCIIKLLYTNKSPGFDARAKRFGTEFPKFEARRHPHLHDRFVIIDSTAGFISGPSLKDAASHFTAIVVKIEGKERALLEEIFQEFWKSIKA
ncbi:MAG: hypothetical protein PHS14_17760 [Elusimicrobia bacterium]|nr:hypothetical protein [Elusimicrobiota bacterium]